MSRTSTFTVSIAAALALAGCQTPRPSAPATVPIPVPATVPAQPVPAPAAPVRAAPPVPAAQSPPPPPAAPRARPPPKPPTLDLNSLEQRLKDTRAIGVFTKLSLKNQVDDLLGQLRAFHAGSGNTAQSELRQKYDLLILKVLSLLQDGDPQLASAIASSREAIWSILMDPQKFSQI